MGGIGQGNLLVTPHLPTEGGQFQLDKLPAGKNPSQQPSTILPSPGCLLGFNRALQGPHAEGSLPMATLCVELFIQEGDLQGITGRGTESGKLRCLKIKLLSENKQLIWEKVMNLNCWHLKRML